MSQENIELARRGYEALNEAYRRRDVDYLRPVVEELWHPEIVATDRVGRFPETGEWHGREAVLGFVLNQTEAFDQMWLEPEEFIDAGDHLIVAVRFGGRARHTELPVEFTAVHLWTMQDGKAVRFDFYDSTQDALEAAGEA
jgi:ketosteroid isomerase-like protein